jgi:outer membrane protein OmpA-like peptidoglycan-associated protein
VQVRWGRNSERAARDLDAVAFTIGSDVFVDTNRFRPGTREGDLVLAHELGHAVEQHDREPELALLSEAEFRRQLGAHPEQRVAIDALFANPTFRALWDYLGSCPAGPMQDHGPVRLLVTPGLTIGGVERFGGYRPATRTLEINPTKPEHVNNVEELVDTITHEVLHAVSDIEPDCVSGGGSASPVGGAGTTTPVTGLPPLGPTELGPSASDPCSGSIDIDVAAQRIVIDVIRQNMRTTRLGAPTITLLNELIRSDPSALAAYDACRGPACALANPALRTAAIGRCSMDTLGAFMTGDLLPGRVLFDFDSPAIRPDAATALDLVATFMRGNPTTHVILQGHADPTGPGPYNERLGLKRARAVEAFLLGHGVAAAQIDDVTSEGERIPLSTRPSEFFQDRRVELIFLSTP